MDNHISLRDAARILLSMNRENWEGAVFEFLDMRSDEYQEQFPLCAATDIQTRSIDWIVGLNAALMQQEGKSSKEQLEKYRRAWWRVASHYPDTLWNCRPAPVGRPPMNGDKAKERIKFTLDPDIAEKLALELNKSGLVNDLLRRHYQTKLTPSS